MGLFSLSQHLALVALSIAAFREIENAPEEKEDKVVMIRYIRLVTQNGLVLVRSEGGVRMDVIPLLLSSS